MKTPLPYDKYCQAGALMLQSINQNGILAHTLLTTMWNLMSTLSNTVRIKKNDMKWVGNSLIIDFSHDKKKDSKRKNNSKSSPLHVYANPNLVESCPILSLGLYFLYMDITSSTRGGGEEEDEYDDEYDEYDDDDDEDDFIFPSFLESYEVGDILNECLISSSSTSQELVFDFHKFSIRKGAGEYVGCEGRKNFRTKTAVLNRGGWNVRNNQSMKDFQFHYDYAASDQHVGRTVYGLNPDDDESFSINPPVFKVEHERIVNEILHDCFSCYDKETESFQQVIKMTMASVVYHKDILLQVYFTDPNHPMRSKLSFLTDKDYGISMKELVEIHQWKPSDAMDMTVNHPPLICMIEKMSELKDELKKLKEEEEREEEEEEEDDDDVDDEMSQMRMDLLQFQIINLQMQIKMVEIVSSLKKDKELFEKERKGLKRLREEEQEEQEEKEEEKEENRDLRKRMKRMDSTFSFQHDEIGSELQGVRKLEQQQHRKVLLKSRTKSKLEMI